MLLLIYWVLQKTPLGYFLCHTLYKLKNCVVIVDERLKLVNYTYFHVKHVEVASFICYIFANYFVHHVSE